MKTLLAALVAVLVMCIPSLAVADDWVAVKLRGGVLQLVDGEWVPLQRGEVVSDNRPIRTTQSGRVQFRRDAETIDVGPQSAIQIADRTGRRYTTVVQHFGKVTIEAEVQNVEHFAVETPHLAAVVKGTKFVVVSGKSQAQVRVARGHVAVEDQHNHQTVTVSAGQSASTEMGQSMEVAGRGDLPVVFDAKGKPVDEEAAAAANARADAANASSKGKSQDNSGGEGRKGKSDDGVSVSVKDGVSVGVDLGGTSVSLHPSNSGSGNSQSNSNSGSSDANNSGSSHSGSGNSGSGGGNGNGGGGGLVSSAVETVGGVVGGLL